MADHMATTTNFLNALDRNLKFMKQYKTMNEAIEEKDLPTFWKIVGNTWKKEKLLKGLKSELSVLERKTQSTGQLRVELPCPIKIV